MLTLSAYKVVCVKRKKTDEYASRALINSRKLSFYGIFYFFEHITRHWCAEQKLPFTS